MSNPLHTYDTTRQDSAFYTHEAGTEVVWENPISPRFYVVRAGEMRIHATEASGSRIVIRYTDQLEDFGIKTDEDLAKWEGADEELFSWHNNSWYEVYDSKDTEFFSEPLHTLEDAVNFAVDSYEKYGEDKVAE